LRPPALPSTDAAGTYFQLKYEADGGDYNTFTTVATTSLVFGWVMLLAGVSVEMDGHGRTCPRLHSIVPWLAVAVEDLPQNILLGVYFSTVAGRPIDTTKAVLSLVISISTVGMTVAIWIFKRKLKSADSDGCCFCDKRATPGAKDVEKEAPRAWHPRDAIPSPGFQRRMSFEMSFDAGADASAGTPALDAAEKAMAVYDGQVKTPATPPRASPPEANHATFGF